MYRFLNRVFVYSLVTFLLIQGIAEFCLAEFAGWQGLRVIEQKGRPYLMRAGDLDGDGREELVVVNSRSSRLEIYGYREEGEGGEEAAVGERRSNELPLASDISHEELQLEQVPRDVLIHDVDNDEHPELVVLVSSPNRVLVYKRQGSDSWTQQYKLNLLDGDIPTRRKVMLVRSTPIVSKQLLVSLNKGIQQVSLEEGGRAKWLTPREQRGRLDWWLADLDGDGLDDLVEQTREANESLRWYRCTQSGSLSPAAVLRDRAIKDVEVLHTSSAAQLVVLDDNAKGILRRYNLDSGSVSPFGSRRPLALEGGQKAVWCGMQQGDRQALVVADNDAPRLLSYVLSDAGWEAQQAYPAVTDIKGLAALMGQPGTLLLWTKDAADLQISRWEAGRMTYPKPWLEGGNEEDRKILALDTVGEMTWWVQKVNKRLDLYLSKPGEALPTAIRFADVGAKADQVLWIGGKRLLVKEKNGRGLKLFSLSGDKAKVTSPAHLKKAKLGDFQLFAVDEKVRIGRLTDGVLQWLDDDLRPQGQVMLPQGQELAGYVVDKNAGKSEANGWALQEDSSFVHRIEIDASGLSKSVERVEVVDGAKLLRDPVLGMLLVGSDRVTHLREGRPRELKLVDVIDDRVGRSGGVRKTLFHKLSTTDIDRDGYGNLVLYDQLQHRLTVLGAGVSGDGKSALQPVVAWPVFDDKKYPYSDDSENLVREPRSVLAADFDGDRLQDMAILSHDRLIIYLARERF